MTDIELLTPNKIIKSKRKTLAIQISTSGELIVIAPINCSEEKINKFIVRHQNWIIEKRLKQMSTNNSILNFEEGNVLSILGENYDIKLSVDKCCKVNQNTIYLPINNREQQLKNFLKSVLKEYVEKNISYFESLLNVKAKKITISEAKSNWGSCSFKNNLHFTFRLALCPKEVVNYVIIHELCHIKEKNHSRSFWTLVGSLCPNYKQMNKWLKDNRHIMDWVN